MKKWMFWVAEGVLFILMAFLLSYFVSNVNTRQQNRQNNVLYLEVGLKMSDIKWLHKTGKISEEEWKAYQATASDGINVQELNELLDTILEGKVKNNILKLEDGTIFVDN